MTSLKNELRQLDTPENNINNLDIAWEAFVLSPYADCLKRRTSVFLLFQHLRKAF